MRTCTSPDVSVVTSEKGPLCDPGFHIVFWIIWIWQFTTCFAPDFSIWLNELTHQIIALSIGSKILAYKLAGVQGFEPWISVLETDVLAATTTPPSIPGLSQRHTTSRQVSHSHPDRVSIPVLHAENVVS